uniref:Uncharacterized protein n=1 Tax=Chromera velia CCMP2878 TaxID=1169474 RepID=A0A0K6S7G8_9ALVE|eukprot:Cvel_20979.t2-p1 / transcript=Cvel_20979.t2 / gene=Cvel_20979 / organism=Chromera_velia_CCMP2878 / gene_product=hypothetical protein / transcript_product=hypothetical protein / location=Cvel_scaffold1930:5782-6357(+) / protein_length=192 / sequence_SO=supercontig / SO=protein_coding / is_pseudo=false
MEEVPLRSPSRQQPKPFNKDPDPDEDQNAAPMAGQEDLLLEEGEEEEGGTEGPPPAKPSRLTDVYADRARALDMSEPSVSRRSNEEEGDDTGRQSAGNSDGSTQLCLSFSSEDQKPECRGEGEKGEEGCGGKGNEGEETRDSATKTEETIAERGAGIFPFRLPVKGEGKGEGSGKDTNAAAGMQMKAGEAKQ